MGIARQGRRHVKRKEIKEVKKHKKEFFNILTEIDRIIPLLEKEEITEDNLEEKVSIYSNITLGNIEKIILRGRLKIEQNETIKNK